MAIEQSWLAVPPQLFTADGGEQGQIKLDSTRGFKTKMFVVVQDTAGNQIELQVKRVNKKSLIVGPKPGDPNTMQGKAGLKTTTDLRAYTVANGAFVYAVEQRKVKLKPDDITQAVYEQEPTVAIRTVQVDENGDIYGPGNPLPIAFDGTIAVGNVTIQDDDGHELEINPDGSLNVNVVIGANDGPGLKVEFGEALAVPAGIETNVLTVTASTGYKRFQKIEVSGSNVSEIRLKIDGVTFAKKFLWWGNFNTTFTFEILSEGLKLMPGQVLTVTATHIRPDAGDFSATAYIA